MSNDTVRELQAIRKLLARIAAKVTNRVTGTVTENEGSDGDVPSQLTPEQRRAMKFMDFETHGRGKHGRRTNTQPVPGRAGRM